jgi:hypothetical protein
MLDLKTAVKMRSPWGRRRGTDIHGVRQQEVYPAAGHTI